MVKQEQPIAESASEKAAIRVILFELSGEVWGIDFKDIQEVLAVQKSTPVPKTPAFILGVINHRGKIITVIDFVRLFGEGEDGGQGRRIVHLRSGKGNVGLLIRSNLLMDSLPKNSIERGRVEGKSTIIPNAPLPRRIVQRDTTEISLVDEEEIMALIGRYPFKVPRISRC